MGAFRRAAKQGAHVSRAAMSGVDYSRCLRQQPGKSSMNQFKQHDQNEAQDRGKPRANKEKLVVLSCSYFFIVSDAFPRFSLDLCKGRISTNTSDISLTPWTSFPYEFPLC